MTTIDNESPPGAWQREIDHAPFAFKPIEFPTGPDPNARGGVRRYLDTVKPEEYKPNTGEVNLSDMTLTGLADLYGSDKGTIKHNYTVCYEKIINDILAGRDRKTTHLTIGEAGVACGASLRMWGNYLPASFIIGYDIRKECEELCKDMKNVKIITKDLCKEEPSRAELFDLFIDDASHISEDMAKMFEKCWDRVSYGGYYVIEDLGCTYSEAYTTQFRKHFNPDAQNKRESILRLMNWLMQTVDRRGMVKEIRYYPQLLVVKKV